MACLVSQVSTRPFAQKRLLTPVPRRLLQLRDLAHPRHPPGDAPVVRPLLDLDVRRRRRSAHGRVARRQHGLRDEQEAEEERRRDERGLHEREAHVIGLRVARGLEFILWMYHYASLGWTPLFDL